MPWTITWTGEFITDRAPQSESVPDEPGRVQWFVPTTSTGWRFQLATGPAVDLLLPWIWGFGGVAGEFEDSGVELEHRFWIENRSARKERRTRSQAVRAVKRTFEESGIEIPYPHRRDASGRQVGRRGSVDGRPRRNRVRHRD